MSGLPPGADGRNSYPRRLRSGAAFRKSLMRQPTLKPLHARCACFPQATGGVTPAEEKRRRRSAYRKESQLLCRPLLTTLTAPCNQTRPPQHTLSSYPHLAWSATLLWTSYRRFNTHSALVGPRFSTTDF